MKKKLAMLFVVIMLLSCMPVMAVTVPAGADTAAATTGTVTTQAASTGWVKVDKYYRYYYAKGEYLTFRQLVSSSQHQINNHRKALTRLRLSFSLWLIFSLFFFPAAYVFSYYSQCKAVFAAEIMAD